MEYQDYMNLVAAIVEQAKRDSYGKGRYNKSIGAYCACDPPHSARTCAKEFLRRIPKWEHKDPIDLAIAVLEAAQ